VVLADDHMQLETSIFYMYGAPFTEILETFLLELRAKEICY